MAKVSASNEDSDTNKHIYISISSRSARTTVRNVVRKTPHFTFLFMVKQMVTPQGSAKYSMKGLQIKTNLSMENYYNKMFKELDLLQAEAAHQKYKYENLNKDFTKRKTSK